MENDNTKIEEKSDLQKDSESFKKEQEEILYKKNIMRYLNNRQGGDLKYLLKEFSEIQKSALLKEKEEEESQSLNQIFYHSPKVNLIYIKNILIYVHLFQYFLFYKRN